MALGIGLGIIASMTIFLILISLLVYVFTAYSTMKIADNIGYDKSWIAWVPIVNQFMPLILIRSKVKTATLNVLMIVFAISLAIPLFFGEDYEYLSLIAFAISMYAYSILFKLYSDSYAVHTVIAIFTFGLSIPISLFRFRNRTPEMGEDVNKATPNVSKNMDEAKTSEVNENSEEEFTTSRIIRETNANKEAKSTTQVDNMNGVNSLNNATFVEDKAKQDEPKHDTSDANSKSDLSDSSSSYGSSSSSDSSSSSSSSSSD